MTIYIVKYKDKELKFLDVKTAVKEAETLGESGKNTYVYKEIDGVREEEPFFFIVSGESSSYYEKIMKNRLKDGLFFLLFFVYSVNI